MKDIKMEKIADCLRLVVKADDDVIMQAARGELPVAEEESMEDAMELLDAYYRESRRFTEDGVMTETLAGFLPFATILDDSFVHNKVEYYHEEKHIHETEEKEERKLRDLWEAMTRFKAPAQTSLAASNQSDDDVIRNMGHGGVGILEFDLHDILEKKLTLRITRVNDQIDFILDGDDSLIDRITAISIHGHEIPLVEGIGHMDIKNALPPDVVLFVTDSEGQRYALKARI